MTDSPPWALTACHRDEIDWYGILFEELKARYQGLRVEAWVQGRRDAERAREHEAYNRVVDLTQGFDRRQVDPDLDAIRARLATLEDHDPSFRYNRAVTRSRLISTRGWTQKETYAYADHVLNSMDARLRDRSRLPWIAFGENNFLVYQLAHALLGSDVPYLHVEPARIWADRIYWWQDHPGRWPECRQTYDRFRKEGIPDNLREEVEDRVDEIRGSHDPDPRAPKEREEADERNRWLASNRLARLTGQLSDGLASLHEDSHHANPLDLPPEAIRPDRIASRQYRRVQRARAFAERARDGIDPDTRYVAYFLHHGPEAIVDHGAYEHRDQVRLVRHLAAALPADVDLLVKEHKPSVGERDPSFYDEIEELPNAHVVSAEVDSQQMIKHAEAVSTLVGTVGLEALVWGVPVLAFGEIYYDEFGGVEKVRSLGGIQEALSGLLERERGASHDEAIRALAALRSASHAAHFGPEATLDEMRAGSNRERLVASLEPHLPDREAEHEYHSPFEKKLPTRGARDS